MMITATIDLPPDVYIFYLHEGEKVGKTAEHMIELYLAQHASRIKHIREKQSNLFTQENP